MSGYVGSIGRTLFAVPQGQEYMGGIVYSQFYGLIKMLFNSSKTYGIAHDALENLALILDNVQSYTLIYYQSGFYLSSNCTAPIQNHFADKFQCNHAEESYKQVFNPNRDILDLSGKVRVA